MKKVVVKSLSYRAFSLVVSAAMGYAATGSFAVAASLASLDAVVKLGLYAAHEAAWSKFASA